MLSIRDRVAEQLAGRYGASVDTRLRHQGPGVWAVGGWDGRQLVGDVLRVTDTSARAATAVEANTLRINARDAAQQ